MKRRRHRLAHPGFLALLCACGLFLFYWPFLLHPGPWRQPHTALYLFGAWAALIVVIFLVSLALRQRPGGHDSWPPNPPGGEE